MVHFVKGRSGYWLYTSRNQSVRERQYVATNRMELALVFLPFVFIFFVCTLIVYDFSN